MDRFKLPAGANVSIMRVEQGFVVTADLDWRDCTPIRSRATLGGFTTVDEALDYCRQLLMPEELTMVVKGSPPVLSDLIVVDGAGQPAPNLKG